MGKNSGWNHNQDNNSRNKILLIFALELQRPKIASGEANKLANDLETTRGLAKGDSFGTEKGLSLGAQKIGLSLEAQ